MFLARQKISTYFSEGGCIWIFSKKLFLHVQIVFFVISVKQLLQSNYTNWVGRKEDVFIPIIPIIQ